MQHRRYEELDALRGIAAVLVVFFHAGHFFAETSPLVTTSLTQNGYLMVDFFFVLSGFVIASSYFDRLSTPRQVVVFQTRRAARLLPLHIVTLLSFLGIEIWLVGQNLDLEVAAFERNSIGAFFSNLFLIQPFTQSELTFNIPAWSIAVEFYTYLLFALTCLICAGRRFWMDVILGMTVLGAGAFLFLQGTLDLTQSGGLVRCLFSFALGVLVYRTVPLLGLPWILSLGAIALPIVLLIKRDVWSVPDLVFPGLFALTILTLAASATDTPVKRVLRLRPLRRLGDLSYGIYLWHCVVFWVLPHTIGSALNAEVWIDPTEHHVFITLAPFGHTLLLLLGLLFTYLMAALSYALIEKPINAWAKGTTKYVMKNGGFGQPTVSSAARSIG